MPIDAPNHPASLGNARRKIREIKFGNYRHCKFGPHYLLAQQALLCLYWRSAGIPIINSSADFLKPLCRVFPIRQNITYWFCFTGAETEIHKIKDDSKINREKNIDRRGQRHIVNVWHLSDPPSFSFPTTFNVFLPWTSGWDPWALPLRSFDVLPRKSIFFIQGRYDNCMS